MKNILSYDSKFIQILSVLADTMILNILFLLCCVPVVTIGAATTALFSGCRAIVKEESCFRAFFRSFRSDFLRSTAVWLIYLAGILAFAWITWFILANKIGSFLPALFTAGLALIFLMSAVNMTLLFYSNFGCTLPQLLKDGFYMTLGHLLRSLLMGVAMWIPPLFFFLLPDTFMQLAIVWVLLYFSSIANLCVRIMKKPFARIAEASGLVQSESTPNTDTPTDDVVDE